ncbi:universal stress protein [Halopenitus salinus]|uniref:Universal stress protein n=1 Tax=Halopenitus salinus TaxID=1198295 RepID=A0ABD5UNP9_9EURY
MYETILIPVDGSEHAIRAAEHGSRLAGAFDADLHLLNVADVQSAGGLFNAGGVDGEFVRRIEEEGRNVLEAAADAIEGRYDAEISTAVVRGEPSETILEHAEEVGADLLAMGTHGRTGVNRYIAGSVTERVVRLSETPVLTTRATVESDPERGYDDVLVPTDGSEAAEVAVEHGLAIAERTGARVHAVSVVSVRGLETNPEYTRIAELREHLTGNAKEAVDDILARAEERGIDAVGSVPNGSPGSILLEYVDEHDVDLVAMGTHGRTGLDRYLIGSTAERLIRRCAVPVVAVNAGRQ